MTDDAAGLDAPAIAAAVNAGALDPLDVIEVFLARIERRNGELNALVNPDPDAARRDAVALREKLRDGVKPALAGVPVIVKDNVWVGGRRITQGSRLFQDFVAPKDAVAVARLRDAGAVVIGVGACPEFACKGYTTSPLYGAVAHPMDARLTPGGSSGGNAAALAADFAPIALGTDAGGSGRRPAAHCGLVGLKPSQGAFPNGPGFREPFWGISMLSPMGRTVADVAAMFAVIAGRDACDAETIPLDPPGDPARPLRIAFSPRLGLDAPVDADVEACIDAAIERLRAAGLAIAQANPVWPSGAAESNLMPIVQAGLALIHGEEWRARPERFDPEVGAQIEAGFRWSGRDIAAALELSAAIRLAVGRFFERFDLLLGPTAPCVSWPKDRPGPATIGGVDAPTRGHAVFTPLFNHAQTPAISIPAGAGRDGLPVGLQIVGPRGADWRVIEFARRAETILRAAQGQPLRGLRPSIG